MRVLQLGGSYCPKLAGDGGVAAGERDERTSCECGPFRPASINPQMMTPPFWSRFGMWPSTRVNKPENDDPSILEPIDFASA
jgi:hypothetical protein